MHRDRTSRSHAELSQTELHAGVLKKSRRKLLPGLAFGLETLRGAAYFFIFMHASGAGTPILAIAVAATAVCSHQYRRSIFLT